MENEVDIPVFREINSTISTSSYMTIYLFRKKGISKYLIRIGINNIMIKKQFWTVF